MTRPIEDQGQGRDRALRDATVQEIQLELIRRTSFNELIGEQVHRSLLLHRDLWTGTILDRVGYWDASQERGRLLPMSLIKLRDLHGGFWNADTLFVLTPDQVSAEKLAYLAEAELWMADDVHVYEEDELATALGVSRTAEGPLSAWWD